MPAAMRSQRLGRFEHRLGVPVDFDVFPHLRDASVAVDQDSRAAYPHELATVHRFLTPDAVCLDNALVGIGEQVVGQGILLFKLFLRGRIIGGNS